MRRQLVHALTVALLAALTAVAAASATPRAVAVPPSQAWLALPTWSSVQQAFGRQYWPQPFSSARTSQYGSPGELQYAARSFGQAVRESWNAPHVRATLTLFDTAGHAAGGLEQRVAAVSAAPGVERLATPAVGDEAVLLRISERGGWVTTLLFLRTARAIGAVEVVAPEAAAAARVAAVARTIVARTERLLTGTLRPTAPGPLLARLPARVGPARLAARAVLPLESWAVQDSSGDPLKVRQELRTAGAKSLPFAAYSYGADPATRVDVLFYPLRDAFAARSWVGVWLRGGGEWRTLPTGKTGPAAVFARRQFGAGAAFELAFAAGRTAVSVVCLNQRREIAGCAATVRALGERLYAALAPKSG